MGKELFITNFSINYNCYFSSVHYNILFVLFLNINCIFQTEKYRINFHFLGILEAIIQDKYFHYTWKKKKSCKNLLLPIKWHDLGGQLYKRFDSRLFVPWVTCTKEEVLQTCPTVCLEGSTLSLWAPPIISRHCKRAVNPEIDSETYKMYIDFVLVQNIRCVPFNRHVLLWTS